MIEINVRQTKGFTSILISGHASTTGEDDIVCAAVSAIVETAVLGLAAMAERYPEQLRHHEINT